MAKETTTTQDNKMPDTEDSQSYSAHVHKDMKEEDIGRRLPGRPMSFKNDLAPPAVKDKTHFVELRKV
jgi:hypothetical protein